MHRWQRRGFVALGLVLLLPWAALETRAATLLANTLWLVLGTWAISLPLGAVLAWLLWRTDLPGRTFALLLFSAMLFVPLYLQAAGWQAGLGNQGWLVLACRGPLLLEGWRGAIWVHAMQAVPWVVLLVGLGLWLGEPELEELAILDGSPWAVFWRVTLRNAAGAVLVAALWVALATAGEMTATDLFSVRSYAEEVYTERAVEALSEEAPLGIWPGVALLVWLGLGGLAVAAKVMRVERPLSLRPRYVFRLGRWRWPAAAGVALSGLVLVGVPLGNLAYQAGIVVRRTEAGWSRSWSLLKAGAMVAGSPRAYAAEFCHSLQLATLAALAAVALAAALAWWARRGPVRAGLVLGTCALGLAVPGPLWGLGIVELLNRPDPWWFAALYDHPLFAPWLALTLRSLPLVVLILWHAFATLPAAMLDAAAVEGAGRLARFWRIVLPCRLPAIGLAWGIAFAVAVGDLAASILVMPPGPTTLSIRIFQLLHYGQQDHVAGICLALGGSFAALTSLAILGRRMLFPPP